MVWYGNFEHIRELSMPDRLGFRTLPCTISTLNIECWDRNNKAKGPVTIQGLQNGDSVVVYLDDKKTSLKSGNKLTESGTYKVLAYDQAGNVTQKDFEISLYLNIKSVFLFIAFVSVIKCFSLFLSLFFSLLLLLCIIFLFILLVFIVIKLFLGSIILKLGIFL